MDPKLQQRIVGAIVLVALGVIFIPALLDGSGYKSRHDQTIDIPSKPTFPSTDQVSVKPIPNPVDEQKKEIEVKQKEKASKPIESWVIQVGTFDNKKNATSFRDQLRKKKYVTFMEATRLDGKTSYRVRVGPDVDKARLEKLKDKLLKEEKIKGFIIKHLEDG